MAYAFCSSKDCDNKVVYNSNSGMAPKFCGKCGSPMISSCPSCGAKINESFHKFCENCGKPYK